MEDTTTYGKLNKEQLRAELVEVCAALSYLYNTELPPLYADKTRTYLEAYARSPGHSVVAKEREGEYASQDEQNDLSRAELRVESLKVKRQLLELLYAE